MEPPLRPHTPPLRLPVPNEAEVAAFGVLYERRFGVTLTKAEAYDLCSRLVSYIYLTTYALPHLRSEEQRIRRQAGTVD